jgi:hypothetical protein
VATGFLIFLSFAIESGYGQNGAIAMLKSMATYIPWSRPWHRYLCRFLSGHFRTEGAVNAMARHVWTCSLFLLILSITLVAQTHTISLSGTITDPSAKPVPNASVSLKNLGTGKSLETKADADGKYSFSDLPSGRYELSASRPGFGAKTTTINSRGPASNG